MHEGGAAVFTTMFYSLYNRGPKIHPSFPTSRKLEPQKVSKNESFCGHRHPSDEGKGKHTNTWRLTPKVCKYSAAHQYVRHSKMLFPSPSFRFSLYISLRNKNRNPNHQHHP